MPEIPEIPNIEIEDISIDEAKEQFDSTMEKIEEKCDDPSLNFALQYVLKKDPPECNYILNIIIIIK